MDVCLDGSTDGYAGRIEVLEGRSGRRFRSEAERARIAAESMVPGAKVVDVARRHAATRWQVYDWRRKLLSGALVLPSEIAGEPMFAALVVEAKPARPAPGPRRHGGAARSSRIEMVVEGVTVHVPPDIDEAQLTGLIRAIRMASR